MLKWHDYKILIYNGEKFTSEKYEYECNCCLIFYIN